MMRSLFSGVSGLKTHQTKMDVIGNNIANVNTVAFKSSSVTFSDIMYQTTSSASGANAATGLGGVNAKQIGLGVTTAATSINVTSQGAAQNTGGAFDIRLSDSSSTTSFFVVNNGSENVFTRSGSFYIDGSGNLCMSSTGYRVMGWQAVDGEIVKDTASALQVMNENNLTCSPEATTNAYCAGVLDSKDSDVTSSAGYNMSLNFYDALGYAYNAKLAVKSTGVDGTYTVEVNEILDSYGNNIMKDFTDAQKAALFGNDYTGDKAKSYTCKLKGNSVVDPNANVTSGGNPALVFSDGTDFYEYDRNANPPVFYEVSAIKDATGNMSYTRGNPAKENISLATFYNVPVGSDITLTGTGTDASTYGTCTAKKEGIFYELAFNTSTGLFSSVGDGASSVYLNLQNVLGGNFENISVDFSSCKEFYNSGKTTMSLTKGTVEDASKGTGKKLGSMIGISVSNDGKIYGTYDNGNKKILGQVVVAQFANAAGLEKCGDNCYKTTLNSGDFDGVGQDITASGGTMAAGQLEMSNVDLSTEFTEMITTQRGFQANSRIITTSDSMLEELVNLKR